jgi:hypothetical protein
MSDSEVLGGWKARLTPRPVTLSTGDVVMIRPVTMEALVAKGTIPLPIFQESMAASQRRDRKKVVGIDEDFLKMLPSVNAVVMAAAVVPRVAEGEVLEEGVVSLDSILLGDRFLIFEEASGAARALRSFPVEPGGGGGLVSDGDDVSPAAE